MKRERERKKETFRRQRHHQSDDGVDAETSLSFMSISLLRLFSRAHYWVNKYILKMVLTDHVHGTPDSSVIDFSLNKIIVSAISHNPTSESVCVCVCVCVCFEASQPTHSINKQTKKMKRKKKWSHCILKVGGKP